MNRITGRTCAFVCMSECTCIHTFLISTTISSYPKSSEIHRIALNPLNRNWKKIIHLCDKPVRNSFCFILKNLLKLTGKETKTPKSNQPKKHLEKQEVTKLKKQTLTQFYIISTTACDRKPLMNSVGFRSRRVFLVKWQKAPTTFILIPAMALCKHCAPINCTKT